jgi:hypothetical protein
VGSGSATPAQGQWCPTIAVCEPTVGARDWRMLYVRCMLAVVCDESVCECKDGIIKCGVFRSSGIVTQRGLM